MHITELLTKQMELSTYVWFNINHGVKNSLASRLSQFYISGDNGFAESAIQTSVRLLDKIGLYFNRVKDVLVRKVNVVWVYKLDHASLSQQSGKRKDGS